VVPGFQTRRSLSRCPARGLRRPGGRASARRPPSRGLLAASANGLARIGAVLDRDIAAGRMPGVVLAIARDGEFVICTPQVRSLAGSAVMIG
jgi:hypothetical protein